LSSCLIMEDGSEHTIGDEEIPLECFRCGVCCMLYRPKVNREEIARIAQELSIREKEFISKFVRTMPEKSISIIQTDTEYCPFLSLEKETLKATCLIHHCRPHACVNWQASLMRPECRDGLNKLFPSKTFLLPKDMCSSPEEMKKLYSAVSIHKVCK
jgi:hypothetical protein